MNTKLNIIERRIERMQSAKDDINSAMKKIFPAGKKIFFKRDNMKQKHSATVIQAQVMSGHAELRITDIQTGKDRTIQFSDVVEI